MLKEITLSKGLDIRMEGKAEKIMIKAEPAETYSVKPIDFHGHTPKMMVEINDIVKAGSPLFYDKKHPEILFTSPVSGSVVDIIRGEKRKILEVVIKNDHKDEYEHFSKEDPLTLTRENIIATLLKSGLWPTIKQRPFNVLANPAIMPKAIYISAFDKAPLAPDVDFLVRGFEPEFQIGVNALSKLTKGGIHIGVEASYEPSKVFRYAKGVTLHPFTGKHPAGNVGVQIHHISPINKGEIVWTLSPQDVITIGLLFEKGIYDPSLLIALTGSEVLQPKYYRVKKGASIKNIIENNITHNSVRFISGNPLTGSKIAKDGHLGYFDHQVCVIPEGDYYEMLGWALPGIEKFSMSRTFFSWLFPSKKYKLDTNYHGGERAFVMTGQYENVTPMDIYPQQLIKAIMINDVEMMENLGIYEVVEEDLALCEFVCTSKIEVQSILREGMNTIIEEFS